MQPLSFFYPGKVLDESALAVEQSAIENLPLRHVSPSAIRSYLTDRQGFFRRYVRLEFDTKGGASMVEGNAFHKVLELYYSWKIEFPDLGEPAEEMWNAFVDEGISLIHAEDAEGKVDWGKTGSVEDSVAMLKQAIASYRGELPKLNPVAVEKKIVSEFRDENDVVMPLPIKTFSDLISAEGEEIDIVDHKLVTNFVDAAEPQPAFEIQAACNFFTVKSEYGKPPRRMRFIQTKKSKNECELKVDEIKKLLEDCGIEFDKKLKKSELVEILEKNNIWQRQPQVVEYVIDFFDANGNPHQCLKRFLELYRRVLCELSGMPLMDHETGIVRFLPNPFAQFGWKESWLDFCEETDNGVVWDLQKIRKAQENAYSDEGVDAADI